MSTVINMSAEEFLQGRNAYLPAVFTSLPDPEEMGWDIAAWRTWFVKMAGEVIMHTDPKGYAVFYQTDRKVGGELISKAAMIMEAAAQKGCRVVFHRIALTGAVGTVNLFRPGFTHIIAVSRNGKPGRLKLPEVIEAGRKVYPNATGFNACDLVFRFLQSHGIREVFDLFCGRGSIGYIGTRYFGMDVTSVDIDRQQCIHANVLLKTASEDLNFLSNE